MAITAFRYGLGVLGQYSATAARRVDWVTDTIKVALLKEGYIPDQDVHDFFSDVSAQEIAGAGYTAGGVALGTKTATYDAATNTTRLDAADSEWVAASFTAYYAVILKDTGVAATSPLLGYVDFGENKTVSSGTFKIEWDSTDGVIRSVAS